jgi:hypothetical protein
LSEEVFVNLVPMKVISITEKGSNNFAANEIVVVGLGKLIY